MTVVKTYGGSAATGMGAAMPVAEEEAIREERSPLPAGNQDGPVWGVRPTSAHPTDRRTAREVVFYRLGQKFVDNERSIPEDVRSVLYYTLAIGHHTGVIDCLQPRLSTSRAVFAGVLDMLEEGEARQKLAAIEKFGEIEVKKEHVGLLKPAVIRALARQGAASPQLDAAGDGQDCSVIAEDAISWLEEFLLLLEEIQCEPQVYAMGRRVS